MPKRWRVWQAGVLGAFCGLCYAVFMNLHLLPYAFESFDMTAYLTSSFISSTAAGIAIFVAIAVIHNLVNWFRTRRSTR